MTTKLARVCLLVCLIVLSSRGVNATTAVQFVSTDGSDTNNGLTWTTPKATVSAAITALPATGGVVWMASLPTGFTYNLGTLDPGSKPVTLYLGCNNPLAATPHQSFYTADQIKLRTNFHLIGCGSGQSVTPTSGTIIYSTGTQAALVVLGDTTNATQGVVLQGFRLENSDSLGSSIGIDIVAIAGGLWYSTMSDIQVGVHNQFSQIGMNFDGTSTGLNQFISIRDVRVFRNSSATTLACQWVGANGQFVMDNLECDGTGETGTNMNIASSSGTRFPYNLSFNELTTQGSALAVNISGAITITFHQSHLENDLDGFLLNLGTGGLNTYGITIEDSELGTVGVNGGAGYLVKTTASASNSSLNFIHNRVGTTPDNYFLGFTTNLSEIGTQAPTGAYRASTIQGGLTVMGNFTVMGGTKSAGVTLQDGRTVALYAVESPENWFEDFGTGQLKKGTATVKLDREFMDSVNSEMNYSVFVTPEGPCGELYVSKKTPTEFEIRQSGHHTCQANFDYRIVARRRGFEKMRLEEVKPPIQ